MKHSGAVSGVCFQLWQESGWLLSLGFVCLRGFVCCWDLRLRISFTLEESMPEELKRPFATLQVAVLRVGSC